MTTLEELVRILNEDNFVVLDTETTGLHHAEVCQIAICNNLGNIIMDTMVKTQRPIPQEATNIHGITNAMVKISPTWLELNQHIIKFLAGKDVIIYNADFDIGIIETTNERWGILQKDRIGWQGRTFCAMKAYAQFNGDWSDYHGNYKYVALSSAYHRMVKDKDLAFKAHTAAGDVIMTYDVCKALQSAFNRT